jgi:hypothetical protein
LRTLEQHLLVCFSARLVQKAKNGMSQPWGSGKAAFKKPLLSGYQSNLPQKKGCVNHFF